MKFTRPYALFSILNLANNIPRCYENMVVVPCSDVVGYINMVMAVI